MKKIELTTHIKAPINRCFDLTRSVDLRKVSVKLIREQAVGGVTSGLLGLNQRVLWQVTHLGIRQSIDLKISKYTAPYFFTDEMVTSIFKSMLHDHYFYDIGNETVMIDHFYYKTPFGLIGEVANLIFLKRYLTHLLTHRNEIIREYAESEKWKNILLAYKQEESIVC